MFNNGHEQSMLSITFQDSENGLSEINENPLERIATGELFNKDDILKFKNQQKQKQQKITKTKKETAENNRVEDLSKVYLKSIE